MADDAAAALKAARDHLLDLQHPDGWWKGELETNVTMDAEDLLLRHFLGILDAAVAAKAAAWIRSQQHDDGAWGTFYGAPGDLSATVEAYVALRLAGDQPDAPHMARAATWARERGGVGATRVFTRIWLAMVGRWDWEALPVVPAEIMYLPRWVPLNIYDFGCWARQTVVALAVVMAHRPARPLPFGIDELIPGPERPGGQAATSGQPGPERPGGEAAMSRQPGPERPGGEAATSRQPGPERPGGEAAMSRQPGPAADPQPPRVAFPQRAFLALDRVLHRYERLPKPLWRRHALRLAEQWIVRRQEADGCWGGIQPPLVYSVIALHLQGYALDHPVMAAALAGMDGFLLDDERGRRVEACQSPVWDTALSIVALVDAGVAPDDPAIVSAARWLAGEEVRVRGDWAVRRPGLAAGGWAFEFANVNYPDIDDTAEVVMALRRAGAADDACQRGVDWTVGMQSHGGGWGAFDADNDSRWVAALPFCDFGEVTDPPSADVTAHVVEMLADEPRVPPRVVERGVEWLWGQQEADGSWFGRWGVNHVYGTGAAVPALVAAGISGSDPRIRRAVAWLAEHQRADGGWGEDLRSYVDGAWRGLGESTASQTAWALLALVAAGDHFSPAARRGVEFLVSTQRGDGTWDEPWFTGTGFPWDFSINYHLYRLVFPVMALGRWLQAAGS